MVHNENASDVKLDVVALLLRLGKVEGSALGDEDNGVEFELTLDREVLDSKVIPVVGKTLVERAVFLSSDIGGITSPERLRLVKFLFRDLRLLDFLGLLLAFLVLDFLNLGLFGVFVLGFFLILLILNFLKNEC